jgi:acetoin utilization protein AcuB
MTCDVVTTSAEASLAETRALMKKHHIRQLPVINASGTLVGIVSQRDINDATLSKLSSDAERRRELIEKNIRVGDVMTTDVKAILADTPCSRAAAMLQELRVGALPVMNEGMLVGLISSSDFLGIVSQLLAEQGS